MWRETLKKEFTNAIEGPRFTEDVIEILSQEGFTPKNTLFANSTCPDEINRTVTNFERYYGDNFYLGGLTGYPFTGTTGFSAYSHHCPDDCELSNLLIIYGPHVGISNKGELGKVQRRNMKHETDACGSAIAFLKKFNDTKTKGEDFIIRKEDLDYQQSIVEELFAQYGDEIISASNPIKRLVEVNYNIIDKALVEIIKSNKFPGQISLIGGIMINTPYGNPGYFDLRRFEIINYQRKGKTKNLINPI
jgi:hypothetical protein